MVIRKAISENIGYEILNNQLKNAQKISGKILRIDHTYKIVKMLGGMQDKKWVIHNIITDIILDICASIIIINFK